MTRAGVIALLLLGSGLSPVVAAATATAAPDTRPGPPPGAAAVTTSTGVVAASPAAADDESDEDTEEDESADPLAVSITELSPSTLPRRGRVTLSGRVTNDSDSTWTELTVYAATSATPITTPAELVAAEAGPPGVEPDDYQRLVDPRLYERVPDLAPGESTTFSLSLPRRRLELPTSPGLYRLGVQVLGTEDGGREDGADGRARVLVASVPEARRTRLAVAVQVRRRTVRNATGQVDYTAGWERSLGRQGRLRQVVGLLESAAGYPVTAVVDPAVVEAVGSLAEGNTGFDLEETSVDGVEEVTGTITGSAPTTAPDDAPDDAEPGDEGSGEESGSGPDTTAVDSISWLQQLRGAAEDLDVMAISYGDLDLGAAIRHGQPDLVGRSVAAGISVLSAYGVQATGLVAPYHGLLGPETAAVVPQGVPMMVARRSFVAAVDDGAQERVLDTRARVVPAALTSGRGNPIWTYTPLRSPEGAAVGDSALEMRQRILARAALQALDTPDQPVVVVLPPQWRPGEDWARSDFFDGLRAPWLRATPLDALEPDRTPVVAEETAAEAVQPDDSASEDSSPEATTPATPGSEATSALALRYPRRQLDVEVPRGVFAAARRLASTGTVIGGLVVDGDALGPRVQRQALLGPSFHTRRRAAGMIGRLRATDNVLDSQVHDVEVIAPRFVRMSSESGSFLVPVVNRLDVPVRVQLRPHVLGRGLTLEVPEPVVVEPRTRQPIRVAATADTIGIRSVRVDLVTAAGDRLYVGETFSIRSSQVARWVWVAMAIGGALLFLTIVVRIIRRVRARRATHGPVLMQRNP